VFPDRERPASPAGAVRNRVRPHPAALDRYAGRNANVVLVVSDRIAVLAARSAEDTGNQPRGSAGISRGGALGWFELDAVRCDFSPDSQFSASGLQAERDIRRPRVLPRDAASCPSKSLPPAFRFGDSLQRIRGCAPVSPHARPRWSEASPEPSTFRTRSGPNCRHWDDLCWRVTEDVKLWSACIISK
jgi:hypothetical protein